jgi:perosamine synthetase
MIPQIQPWIDDAELKQLKRVIKSTFVVEHELTKEFEELTRKLTGAKHAIAMTNGTVALYCCLKALDIGPGDEVIVPNMTFIASANAVIMAGAIPVFCDVDRDTFCIDVAQAKKIVSSKTKAIMPVHLYGQSADMDAVSTFAKKNKLYIVEDAAQGVGVTFKKKHVGTFGNMGVLSYYGNKTITCGEGGIVLTNNDALARRCYKLKNHGREKKGVFIHEDIGYNFSFTEMQAAIGIAQMKKLPRIIKRKQQIADFYFKKLKRINEIKFVTIDERCDPVYWFTSFLCNEVEELAAYLHTNGIQTRRFFYPLHLQPCYVNYLSPANHHFEVSEKIYRQGLSLPSSYGLSAKEQAWVVNKIIAFYENRG